MRTAIKLLLGMTAIGGLGLAYLFIVGYDLGQRGLVCSEEYYGRDDLRRACLYGTGGGRPMP